MKGFFKKLACASIVGASLAAPFAAGTARADEPVKLGYLVKMPEQAWFINEQRAAGDYAKQNHFTVIDIGVPDGEKVLSAIDNLGAQGAKGFVICAPDVRLGPAISARAKRYNMKFVTVDDQLVDAKGKPIADIPHLGLSSFNIGMQQGEAISAEMKRRGWKPGETGALRVTDYELPTAKLRTDGATKALLAGGFPQANIYDAPQKTTDDEGGFNAASPVLSKHANVKHWVIFGMNEETVLGAVRASEQLHIAPADVIGVGINGAGEAFAEFQKKTPTGFYGTIAVSSTTHGRESVQNLYNWVTKNQMPPMYKESTGTLMTRENWQQVRKDLGI